MSIFDDITRALDPHARWAHVAESIPETRALVPSTAQKANAIDALVPATTASVGAWKAPPIRGSRDLLAAYGASAPFRAIVSRVLDSFAAIPFWVGETAQDKDFKHPAIRLLNRYNPDMIGRHGRKLEQLYLDIPGDAISIIAPVADEKKIDIFPVPPTWVTIDTVKGRLKYIVQIGRSKYAFDQSEVFHQRDIDPENPYGRGKGAGFAAADEIQADEYIAKHVVSYYYNSSRPEFIGVLKGASDKQLKSFQDDFDARHRGFRKHWSPVWFNTDVDLHQLTSKLGDERIESLRSHHLEILEWLYGVPPEVFGRVTDSNRATAQESRQIMGEYVLDPRAAARKEFWQVVVDDLFDGAPVNYDSPIPRLFDRRDQIMEKHPWHFTRNEIRREAGYGDVADGDVYMIPNNLTETSAERTISEAGNRSVVLRLIGDGE